ncbi:MAG TPA: helix-turn-helix domain-containing protein [Planctomycetaceae bacterium]|nr:helix-turn-helix domain-containing protein [Planctomycetaceae bacterium]
MDSPRLRTSADDGIPPNLLTAYEAAALLRVSERTLWTLTKRGSIRAIRINRRVLYSVAELQRFVADNTCGDGPA